MSVFDYRRRPTVTVRVGDCPLGGDNPVRIQSMATVSTLDTEGAVSQGRRIIDAGAEYLRFTAQGVREAANLEEIRRRLRSEGYTTPLVADIHFNPRAAFEAALHVEPDRRAAIAWALEQGRPGDVIVLAGKGHETYQEINGVRHHLDEREVVAEYFTSGASRQKTGGKVPADVV